AVLGVPAEAADDAVSALCDQHLDVPSLGVEPHSRRLPGGRPGGTHLRVFTESGDDLLSVGPDRYVRLRRPPVSFEIGSGEHAVLQGDAQLPPSEPEVGGELVSSVVAASCLHWHCRAFLLTLTRTRLLGGTSGGRRNGNLWITRWGTWTYRAFRANRSRGWNMMWADARLRGWTPYGGWGSGLPRWDVPPTSTWAGRTSCRPTEVSRRCVRRLGTS